MSKASLTYTHVDEAARALTRENSEVSVRTVRDFGVTGGSAQMSDLVRDWKAWTRDLLVQVWDMPPDFLAGMQALIHEIKTRADQSTKKALETTVHKCDELIANAEARITAREKFFDGERTRLLADAEIGRRAMQERDALQGTVTQVKQANAQLLDVNRDLVRDAERQVNALQECSAARRTLEYDTAEKQGRLNELHTQLKGQKSRLKEMERNLTSANKSAEEARSRAAKLQAQLQDRVDQISQLETILNLAEEKQLETEKKLTMECGVIASLREVNKGQSAELTLAWQLLKDSETKELPESDS